MGKVLRESCGMLLLMAALGVLFHAVMELRGREYVGAIILVLTGLSVLQAGVELLRPSIGE
jgi:hypothetical protein